MADSRCPAQAVKRVGRRATEVAETIRGDEQSAGRSVCGEDGGPTQKVG